MATEFKITTGDCLDTLRGMPDASIDAVVTDPPYGLGREPDPRDVLRAWLDGEAYQPGGAGFMGKAWDAFVPSPLVWSECWRVLKPGGHLLAFAGSRTYDWIVMGVRLAGFEVRDQLLYLYGSGFPKSLNVSKAIDRAAGAEREVVGSKLGRPGYHLSGHDGGSALGHGLSSSTTKTRAAAATITAPATQAARQWDGWGTALKPAHEPIVMARKPLIGTVAHNVTTHGTGAINVDGCRVGTSKRVPGSPKTAPASVHTVSLPGNAGTSGHNPNIGRWPANIMHDGSPEVLAGFPVTTSGGGVRRPCDWSTDVFGMAQGASDYQRDASTGTAARFYYCAKASRAERERGLTHREPETVGDGRAVAIDNAYQRGKTERRNIHPTVKPVSVMRWLVRLVTPPGGTVLDPYTGSGTTGIAATLEGFSFIGCELSPEYHGIALARILDARANPHEWDPGIDAPAETEQDDSPDVGQTSLLDLV